jgi:hypothetical protein
MNGHSLDSFMWYCFNLKNLPLILQHAVLPIPVTQYLPHLNQSRQKLNCLFEGLPTRYVRIPAIGPTNKIDHRQHRNCFCLCYQRKEHFQVSQPALSLKFRIMHVAGLLSVFRALWSVKFIYFFQLLVLFLKLQALVAHKYWAVM